jgi:hypothetical protein
MQLAQTSGLIVLVLAVASWATPASGLASGSYLRSSSSQTHRATDGKVRGKETYGGTVSTSSTESPSNSSERVVFVHIPKTAGTSFNDALHVLGKAAGVDYEICGVAPGPMQDCLETSEKPILSGEFVNATFLAAINGSQLLPQTTAAWSFLRNPILRTFSELEHLKLHEKMGSSDVEEFLSDGSCPFGESFCRGLVNPEKCMNDPCNIFENHQSHVLGYAGYAENSTTAAQIAEQRLTNGSIRVMITEYYEASVCLFLNENQRIGNISGMFEQCCMRTSVDDADCPLLNKSGLVKHTDSDYWDFYLNDPYIRARTLGRVQEDCSLYKAALGIFQSQVRAVEQQRNVTLLPSADIANWSCESWLAQYTRLNRRSPDNRSASVVASLEPHAPSIMHQRVISLAKRSDGDQSFIG